MLFGTRQRVFVPWCAPARQSNCAARLSVTVLGGVSGTWCECHEIVDGHADSLVRGLKYRSKGRIEKKKKLRRGPGGEFKKLSVKMQTGGGFLKAPLPAAYATVSHESFLFTNQHY